MDGQYEYEAWTEMESRGPRLGWARVLYTRAVDNLIYVGFNEPLNATLGARSTSFLAYDDYEQVYPQDVEITSAYIVLKFAEGVDCAGFDALSYAVPAEDYLVSIRGAENLAVPNFDVGVDYDEDEAAFAGLEARVVRNVNRQRANAGKGVLEEDAGYVGVARLLAVDPGLVFNSSSGVIAGTSFGAPGELFELFGLEAPAVVRASSHSSPDSAFTFDKAAVTVSGVTHIAAGASSNVSHRYVVVLFEKKASFVARLVDGEAAVANQSVEVGGKSFRTDENGVFRGALPFGTYPVYIGEKPMNGTLEVGAGVSEGKVQEIRKAAANTFMATVHLVEGSQTSDKNASGVVVEVLDASSKEEVQVIAPVTTGADGNARLWLPRTNGSDVFWCALRLSHPDNTY